MKKLTFVQHVEASMVHGSCVEPGGMPLDDIAYTATCPECKRAGAQWRRWETCDGAINQHWSVGCDHCGFEDDDGFD